jgi:hypothetical protein
MLITWMFVIAFAVMLPRAICRLLVHPNSLNYHHSSQRYGANNHLGLKDLKNKYGAYCRASEIGVIIIISTYTG